MVISPNNEDSHHEQYVARQGEEEHDVPRGLPLAHHHRGRRVPPPPPPPAAAVEMPRVEEGGDGGRVQSQGGAAQEQAPAHGHCEHD